MDKNFKELWANAGFPLPLARRCFGSGGQSLWQRNNMMSARNAALRTIRWFAIGLSVISGPAAMAAGDPLPSWNAGAAKRAIVDFVAATTTTGSLDFITPGERIAVFDNDGTLWVEKPIYTEVAFVAERVKRLAPEHPSWVNRQPFKAVLGDDWDTLAAAGYKGVVQLGMATHIGLTTTEYAATVTDWLATARHPRFDRLYTELVYEPMREVLAFLQSNGFRTYIVSGGGIDFMRPWTDPVYGVPPEQVVGSSVRTAFEMREGQPVLVRLPEVDFVDNNAGKPVGIHQFVGRRPIAAFGNSDGDIEMLQWVTTLPPPPPPSEAATTGTASAVTGEGTMAVQPPAPTIPNAPPPPPTAESAPPAVPPPLRLDRRLGMIVHHDDAEREYAYDRNSAVGHLDKALDLAPKAGWAVISMRKDWKTIFLPH